MQINSIQQQKTKTQSFKALTITPEAMQVLTKEKGASKKINQYIKDLAHNTKLDINVRKSKVNNDIYMEFSGNRKIWISPFRRHENMIGFYSADARGGNEDDIVDFLKFSSTARAKEIYEDIKTSEKGKSPMQQLTSAVKAAKAYDEGVLITPEEFWRKADIQYFHRYFDKGDFSKTSKSTSELPAIKIKETKPSFTNRLKMAWQVLTGSKN